MNKKISTLMAGFLLAGGLFSTANADNVQGAEEGQYYQLKGAVYYDAGWKTQSGVHYMVTDEAGKVILSNDADLYGSKNGYWTIKTQNYASGTDVQFVNVATGQPLKLTLDGESIEWFASLYYDGSTGQLGGLSAETNVIYVKKGGNNYYLSTTGDGALITLQLASVDWARGFNAIPVDATVYNASNAGALADDNGNGETFNLSIGAQVWNKDKGAWEGFEAYNPLNGNVFAGDLTAVPDGSNMRLQAADGKYIVLTNKTWGTLSGELGGSNIGYKFATMTQKQIDDDANAADKTIVAQYFEITKPSTKDGAPVEVVVTNGTNEYELEVAVVDDKAYLTVGANSTPNTADYTVDDINTENTANNTYVRFGADNNVDYAIFYDKVWNITRQSVDGGAVEAAAPSCTKEFVPVAQVALNQPEGMWIWDGFNFINRESGNTISIPSLRTTDEANVYTNGQHNYTITQVGVPGDYKFNGYFGGEYTTDQLKVKSFRIGSPLASAQDTVYMTLGDDDQIAWTTEPTEAIEFRFTRVETNDLDLVKHFTTYNGLDKDGNIVEKTDTLNFYRYMVTDVTGKKVLYWDNTNGRYMLADEDDATNASYRSNIIFKAKDGNNYNILRVASSQAYASKDDDNDYLTFADNFCNNWYKMYGAHNENELVGLNKFKTYDKVENDLFVIEDAIANLYRSVGEAAALDTIKVFRNENNQEILFESGLLSKISDTELEGFLGLENFYEPEFADKNAAMYADTAAGFGTWRPQFMLAVDATIVPAGKWCEEHQSADCAHAVPTPGYVTGRYLVNLNDSVNTKGVEREDCVYQNYGGENYYRLGFVNAKHIGDTLVIASTGDSISLLNNEIDKYCTFAFRYVDNESDAFIIETAYSVDTATVADVTAGDAEKVGEIMDYTPGYIKFHNGVPVVTSQRSDAEVFDLEVLENIVPTANESIADEAEGVEVIAGNGAVTIQGAAGKTVVITNILGKAVANTTLTSDNQTINVPAGIVVVTVDGEAVKAIVK